ncbi:hypothetical protein ACNKHW_00235 [Shigella flexneri]
MTKLESLACPWDSCCEITFDDVVLTNKEMSGRGGNGFNRVKEEFDHERFLVALLTTYGDVRPSQDARATPTSACSSG